MYSNTASVEFKKKNERLWKNKIEKSQNQENKIKPKGKKREKGLFDTSIVVNVMVFIKYL